MASVHVSNKVIDEIKSEVWRLHDVEVAATTPAITSSVNTRTTDLYDRLHWGDLIGWARQHPEAFRSETDHRISVQHGSEKLLVIVSGPKYIQNPRSNPYLSFDLPYDALVVMVDEGVEGADAVLKLVDASVARRDLYEKWRDIEAAAVRFFRSFNTINQAVNHTPSMGLYVPRQIHERMNEQAVRRTKKQVTVAVDTDALVGSAMAAKLLGA